MAYVSLAKLFRKGGGKLKGFKLLAASIRGIEFKDGERIEPLNRLNWTVI